VSLLGGWVSAQVLELPPVPDFTPPVAELVPPLDVTVPLVLPLALMPPPEAGVPPPLTAESPTPPLPLPFPPVSLLLEQAWMRPTPSSIASERTLILPRTLELVLILNSQMKWFRKMSISQTVNPGTKGAALPFHTHNHPKGKPRVAPWLINRTIVLSEEDSSRVLGATAASHPISRYKRHFFAEQRLQANVDIRWRACGRPTAAQPAAARIQLLDRNSTSPS